MTMKPYIIVVFVSLLVLVSAVNGQVLSPAFYRTTCPQLERVVRAITYNRVAQNPALAAKILRLHYHDCFIRGCDGSVLLDSANGNTAEKDARPNLSLVGYEVIDEIKARLEVVCPGVVSCADILAMAARDAVSYQFGRPMWEVLTGRRDGRVSLAFEAARDLPSGGANFVTLQRQFANLGLNIVDLVALSGAHTIGEAHCVAFQGRLNVNGRGAIDPSLDPEYARFLRTRCPTPAASVPLDANNSLAFNSHYYVNLEQGKGLMASDAALLTDRRGALLARRFQSFPIFMAQFGNSMRKMGAIGVITGRAGEIRRSCRAVN